ncbi:MAG: hypothetical protein ABSB41_01235 [Anaerolineales bacterium]|jgi:chromosome segregation ATPase
MEFEQIVKRLDWLDKEQRKQKEALSSLEDHLGSIEVELKAINKKIKQLADEISNISPITARVEQFEATLAQQRIEATNAIDEIEVQHKENHQAIDKRYQMQIDAINKSISDLRKIKETIAEIKRDVKTHTTEETRRDHQLAEWEARMKATVKASEEAQQGMRAAEDTLQQNNKRITDVQGEISAARKRMEETREKNELFNDNIRRIETRLNEIMASEAERRQAQTNFIETQARLQIERDRVWKEWEERFESFHLQTEAVNAQMTEWDLAQRAVKRAQETYEEIVQKFDRRINEITEMQRLAEDRFRQEWVTFKSDDQKRWTSYTLSQEEAHKDDRSNFTKLEERLTALDDLTQTQQDVLQQTKEANEQLFQGMLAQIHELLSAYERIMGAEK